MGWVLNRQLKLNQVVQRAIPILLFMSMQNTRRYIDIFTYTFHMHVHITIEIYFAGNSEHKIHFKCFYKISSAYI